LHVVFHGLSDFGEELFHVCVHTGDVDVHFLSSFLNAAIELNLHLIDILLNFSNVLLHLGVKLANLLLYLLFGVAKVVFNRLVLDGDVLLDFCSLFSDEFVQGSVLAFDVVFDLRYQTSKVGIAVIIIIVSGQNKAFNLISAE